MYQRVKLINSLMYLTIFLSHLDPQKYESVNKHIKENKFGK